MNLEQLKKGNEIVKKIEICKQNIEAANYTQLDNIVERKTYLDINGINRIIEVPEGLFKVIGVLILSEYNKQLIELEKEFERL